MGSASQEFSIMNDAAISVLRKMPMIMMNMGREVSRRLRQADERLLQMQQQQQ